MTNPIWFLFAVLLAFAYPTGSEFLHFAQRPWAAPAAWAGGSLLLAVASAVFYGRVTTVRRLLLGKLVFRGLSLAGFAALIFVFHFPLFVWVQLRLEEIPVVGDLATLLPYLTFAAIHGGLSSRADERLRGIGARGARAMAVRTFLGFAFMPALLLVLVQTAMTGWMPLLRLVTLAPGVAWLLMLLGLAGCLAGAPFYLRWIFRARPLPPGSKRDRLLALAQRSGFRCREILLFDTGGSGIANAFIVGLHPKLRYVFFTDAIVSGMSDEGLECVMAHEMSHGLRRHLLHYLFFSLSFLLVVLFAQEFLLGARLTGAVPALATFGVAIVFWVGIFGFLSRRFETEADLVGMRLSSVPNPSDPMAGARKFAEALYHVAELNGVPPEAGSWRHFSIARRALLVLQAGAQPEWGRGFERSCAALRTASIAALAFGMLYGAFLVRKQFDRLPEARSEWARTERAVAGWRLLRAGYPAESVPFLEEAARHPDSSGELHLALAEAYERIGRSKQAEEEKRKAAIRGVTDPRSRLRLRPTSDR